jgi:hypothetical protein
LLLEKTVILGKVIILGKMVILSAAKDLLSLAVRKKQALRFAQDDNLHNQLAFLLATDRLRVPIQHGEQGIA